MNYKSQVALLLTVLPEVSKEKCFALHGGTAINLFLRNMPRLSVDIDLTYIPLENRTSSISKINAALSQIKTRLEKLIPSINIIHQEEKLKLQIRNQEAQIKLEVNQGIRGTLSDPIPLELCDEAQKTYDAFCVVQSVPMGQLYGGKICAALDRQHPRDLFDVKYLIQDQGFDQEIKIGFIFALLSSKRPIREILFPHFIDQRKAFSHQFQGMTKDTFTYDDFEKTRQKLVRIIHDSLSVSDKNFILGFEKAIPNWSIYDFEKYPAVQWKLQNLTKLKKNNPLKHQEEENLLKEKLDLENT